MSNLKSILWMVSVFMISGCGDSLTNELLDNSSNELASSKPSYCKVPSSVFNSSDVPKDYCQTVATFSGTTVTISGTVQYEYQATLEPNGDGISYLNPDASTASVRFAEIAVYDENGNLIQCAQTSNTGSYSFKVPLSSKQHKLIVKSRSFDSKNKVNVLEDSSTLTPYNITKSFTPDSSKSLSLAKTNLSSTSAGAFFILDTIIKANSWLATNTSDCSSKITDCESYSPKPFSIFWKKDSSGRALFYGSDHSEASKRGSFYIKNCSEVFIEGGTEYKSGSYTHKDSDTYDDSVILHEFFHFVEDQFGESDNPGGSHSANSQVDTRLAFSEGMANAFQGLVLDRDYYTDHIIYDKSSHSYYIGFLNFHLEDETVRDIDLLNFVDNSCGSDTNCFSVDDTLTVEYTPINCTASSPNTGCDIPSSDNEGAYREATLSRLVWDLVDDTSSETSPTDGVSDEFGTLWAMLTNADITSSNNKGLRSVSLYNYKQNSLSNKADWSTLQTYYKIKNASPFGEGNIHDSKSTDCKTLESLTDLSTADFILSPTDSDTDPNPLSSFRSDNFVQDHIFIRTTQGPLEVKIKMKKLDSSDTTKFPLIAFGLDYADNKMTDIKATACDITESDGVASCSITVKETADGYVHPPYSTLDISAYGGDSSNSYQGRGAPVAMEVTINDQIVCPAY